SFQQDPHPAKSVSTRQGEPQCGYYSGQFWYATDAGNGNGGVRLHTRFKGDNSCLDTYNGGTYDNEVHFVDCGNYSGQLWHFASVNGHVTLWNEFRGNGMCLDIVNGGDRNDRVHLAACGNYTGQILHAW
ncbi:RICIN domain-containing protein, partial [Nocardia seriolae]